MPFKKAAIRLTAELLIISLAAALIFSAVAALPMQTVTKEICRNAGEQMSAGMLKDTSSETVLNEETVYFNADIVEADNIVSVVASGLAAMLGMLLISCGISVYLIVKLEPMKILTGGDGA
jgi:hypothetical protein